VALATVLLGSFVLVAVAGSLRPSATDLSAAPLEAPSLDHPFGTDALGRDLLARTGQGARTSAGIALAAVALSLVVAVPLGIVAGWRAGGWFDAATMRLVEIPQVVPPLILVLLLLGAAGPEGTELGPIEVGASVRIAGCLAIAFVPFFARVVRSATLAERRAPYLAELERLGVGRLELAAGELLPNLLPVLASQALLALAIVVFAEGGLSFLGLGVPPPAPTLGGLVAEAGTQLLGTAWWYALLPGLVLVAGITGLNLAADAAAHALDSRTSRTRS
jgi:ABC-type dipeptide/oligopeptide/nickel transport system permease subunit